ncbi:MAG: ABC transporter ATP-binding protein [Clostridia bacterium]|nr:ABC transporter ATP-binding protein [Clostridia bacterium]
MNSEKSVHNTKSHFNEEAILKDEEAFIKAYSVKKVGSFKLLAKLYKTHFFKLFLSVIFFIIKSAPTWIIPIITANIIDIATLRPENSTQLFIKNIIFAVIVLAINIPFHTLHVKYFSLARRSVEAGLRGAMIRKLQQLSISFHKNIPSGRIQSKVMRDVEGVEALSGQIFHLLLEIGFSMVVTIAIVISKNITIFFIFLITVPIAVLCMLPFRNGMRTNNRLFRKEVENTSSEVMDMISLVPITRAHALEDEEIHKLTHRVTNVAERGYKLDIINSFFGSVNWVVFSAFQIICLCICAVFAMNGEITIGDITLYQTYFTALIGKVNTMTSMLPVVTKGTESINSIGEILSSYDVEQYKGTKRFKKLKGEYRFENVSFHYDDDENLVLKGLNLDIKQGETIAFVGESGSGKTTIINMIIGFFSPNEGEIFIDGQNIKDIDIHSYRKRLAVVPQNTILFSGSIRDNITYGQPNISEKAIKAAVKAANLESVIEKLPHGLDTSVGEYGDKLSGGQKQRVSIARAIIRNPDVIIFDEATSALDSVSEAEIQNAINNLTKDRTTFIVAHRLSTIKSADKIAVMRDGNCVEFGTYDELMEKKGEFYTYKMMQS